MKWFKNEKVRYEMEEYKGYDLEYYSKKQLIDKLETEGLKVESLKKQLNDLNEKFNESLKTERNELNRITEIHNERLKMINYISNMYEFTPLKKQAEYDYSSKSIYYSWL